MFRIRRVLDDVTPINAQAIVQVQEILKSQFPLLDNADITSLPNKLRNPLKYLFRSMLFVAEGARGQVQGFAFVSMEPQLHFAYLDYLSAAKHMTSRGIGGALYAHIRQESKALGAVGLFYECLPDDPALSPDPTVRAANKARLKFYENYGARPISGTAYETPVKEGDDNPPYLVMDDLGSGRPLSRDHARAIVRAVLERKYGKLCPKDYVQMVMDSFQDDPVQLRDFRYVKKSAPAVIRTGLPQDMRIAMMVSDRHAIHHVKERGYVESPARIKVIEAALLPKGLFESTPIRHFALRHITAVHDRDFVEYLRRLSRHITPGKSVYPYVFPIRNGTQPPKELPMRAGYYCMDTFTPLSTASYEAARRAVDCAMTGAQHLLDGGSLAYALVRPPGHHAERRVFGGFCYFNSAAVAAHHLSGLGRVAMLDIDYHHGNGQQDIFYRRSDVLTLSIHGHPSFAYPYFSGFDRERGEGAGLGYNVNYPLPENMDGPAYLAILEKALARIRRFKPVFIVVALGLDTAKGDPTGSWNLKAKDFEANGRRIGALKKPILVVQEGGYNQRNLGANARAFFTGLWEGMHLAPHGKV